MLNIRGSFVVVDGPSGSGKDSLIRELGHRLQNLGVRLFQLSEEDLDPNRQEILDVRERAKKAGRSGDLEMATVLVRHRADIYNEYAVQRMNEGEMVLANRGEPATLAYQTGRGELTMDDVWRMHRELNIAAPNLVVVTTCKPQTAITREGSDRASSQIRGERETGRGLSGKVTNETNASTAEKLHRRELIHKQYDMVSRFLEVKGVPVINLNTEEMTISDEVSTVLGYLGF
jgi:thymidylate kinase